MCSGFGYNSVELKAYSWLGNQGLLLSRGVWYQDLNMI